MIAASSTKRMAIHLKKLGHAVVTATTGEEVLELLAQSPFDLVLMDIEMPEMDGLTATRIIRSGGLEHRPIRNRDIPIVAVTAHVSPEIRQVCAAAGMVSGSREPRTVPISLCGTWVRISAISAGCRSVSRSRATVRVRRSAFLSSGATKRQSISRDGSPGPKSLASQFQKRNWPSRRAMAISASRRISSAVA